jgi:hypothetical protein
LKPLSHATQAIALTNLPAQPIILNYEMNRPVLFEEHQMADGCVCMADNVRYRPAQRKAKHVDLDRGEIHRSESRGQSDIAGKQASAGTTDLRVKSFGAIAGHNFPNLGESIPGSLLSLDDRIAFSHLKRARRWQPLDDAPPEHLTTLNLSLGEPPDEAFLTLLDHVSPASRAVLLLHYQHDPSLEESAAILEIPIGTAKSRLHYGVTTLRKHLASERKPA